MYIQHTTYINIYSRGRLKYNDVIIATINHADEWSMVGVIFAAIIKSNYFSKLSYGS